MRDFFFRVAALTFESSVLAELERGSARRIGDTVREYPRLSPPWVPPLGAPRCPLSTPFSLQTSQATRATCTSRRPARSPSVASEGAAPQRSPPVTPASPYQRAAAPAPPGSRPWGQGWAGTPAAPLAMQTHSGGDAPSLPFVLIKRGFLCFLKKVLGRRAGGRASGRVQEELLIS